MTSAPRSASVRVQIGPAQPIEKSMTRIPASGRSFAAPVAAAGREAGAAGALAAALRRRAGQALHRARGEAVLLANLDRHDRAARPLLFIGNEIGDLGH